MTACTISYQYCSKEECIERQGLGQVSELEATLQTCRLSQANRVLDPRIAVSKYRRSAAGGFDGRPVRRKEQLQETLSHLVQICATLRSTPDHPPIENLGTIVNFVVDRLRACQSDATRLMANPQTCVPSSWHAKVIRILIWLRYSCCSEIGKNDAANDTARTIDHMRSTAYDAYWSTLDLQPRFVIIDDEMLCYDAVSRICAISKLSSSNYPSSLESSWNGMLLEFQKRRQLEDTYPLWNLALRIASHIQREEFHVLWKQDHPLTKDLPVLAKLILSGEVMLLGRYRTVQHYNKSFGKGESVSDMHRLLGIAESDVIDKGWSIEYANVFGIPVEETKNNENNAATTISMMLKQVAMLELDSNRIDVKTASRIQKSDRQWIFGASFDDSASSPMGTPPETICVLLEFGCGPTVRIDPVRHPKSSIDNNIIIEKTTSSLSRALGLIDASSGVSCSFPPSDGDSSERSRVSPLQTAIDRVKQKDEFGAKSQVQNQGKKVNGARKRLDGTKRRTWTRQTCRFYNTREGCKWGDRCKYKHGG